ncbi:NitT/TauT family transport system permease protein [Rhodococcus sp. SMB37]|uniref:ABC transporter permease n=1 Tax=Rhodococcus sp. SMB37 TaxID=2512213 RepID=UPI0010DAED08|nr:ABC transporter permease subunit [Rhodococcus sp. SMB37]TCN55871.1 NitT/TauT family transport system permease protein [Rhodococcus sp. SMB37]
MVAEVHTRPPRTLPAKLLDPNKLMRRLPRPSLHSTVAVLAPVILMGLLALGWEWVAKNRTSVLPTLGAVFTDLVDRPAFYREHLGYTLSTALIGFVIGIVVAIVLAIVVVHVPLLHAAIMPIAVLVHATPIVAVAPALVVAFGFGTTPHLIVVALMVFFPMLINAITGFKAVPDDMMEVFRSMAASKADIFWRLRLPISATYLFAAARTCVTLAMIGAVVSEFHGANQGLGATIVQAMTYLNLPQMWGAIAISALVSLGLLGAVGLLEKVVVRW